MKPTGLAVVLFAFFATAATQDPVSWSECDITQLCVRDPPGCQSDSDCQIVAAFSSGDPGYIRFQLMARTNIPRPYIAVRLSTKYSPERSTIVSCSPRDGSVRFGYGIADSVHYANEETSKRLSKMMHTSKSDGIVRCDFQRLVIPYQERSVALPLTDIQFVQISIGEIAESGYLTDPSRFVVPPAPLNFSAAFMNSGEHLPDQSFGDGRTKQTLASVEDDDEISPDELRSVPEVDESELPFDFQFITTLSTTISTDSATEVHTSESAPGAVVEAAGSEEEQTPAGDATEPAGENADSTGQRPHIVGHNTGIFDADDDPLTGANIDSDQDLAEPNTSITGPSGNQTGWTVANGTFIFPELMWDDNDTDITSDAVEAALRFPAVVLLLFSLGTLV